MQVYLNDTPYFDSQYNPEDNNWYNLIISDSRVQSILASSQAINNVMGIRVEDNKFTLITQW